MMVIGIDPGLGGAVAVIVASGAAEVWDVPTLRAKVGKRERHEYQLDAMRTLLTTFAGGDSVAAIEQIAAFPRNGSIGNFRSGYGLGLWEMALTCAGIPFERVRPARWKQALGLPAGADKARSLLAARALFPSLAAELARVRDDGRAEALLIAEWRRRQG